MDSNNIVTAPAMDDTQTAFEQWRTENSAKVRDFFMFLTTPSAERLAYVMQHEGEIAPRFVGSVAEMTIKISSDHAD